MVGDVELGHDRLAEALNLNIAAIVRANGHGGVDHVRDCHHDGLYALAHGLGGLLKLGKALRVCLDLSLCLLRLGKLRGILLRLTHELSDLFRQSVSARAQLVCLRQRLAIALIKLHDLVHQRELRLLKLLSYVLLHGLRILADKLYIKHFDYSLLYLS